LSTRSSIDLSQFPDSPCAEELRAGASRLRFAPALETAFREHHLKRAHVRTRTWGVVTAFFALTFTIQQVYTEGLLHPASLLNFVLLPLALAIAWLPWSRFYLSHYLPFARIATPVASGLTAPFSAMAAAQGHYEVLILFALQIAGVFQFTGLLFRMALATCTAMVIGFAVGTALWLPPDAAIKYVFTMSVATIVGAVAFRDTEIIARTQYLEDRLLGELLERDPLTGLKNRRSFDEHLQRIWMQAQRDSRAVAVLMIDADDFKRYNDTYGHQAGDDVLRRIGGVLREFGRRPLDLAARYGGEEFALIMNDVTVEHAGKVAEQLRAAVAGLGIAHPTASAASCVTLSVGVAVGKPVLGRTANGLVQLADEALYAAKAAGRNRVILKGPDAYNALESGVFAIPQSRLPERAAG
jgi:diguanylate cyclase (GGDEF)-like protein